MINKMKDYVNKLFEDAPQTKKVLDLKDELTADLIEKYNDLLADGKSEEEAYNLVISGIGDIDDLISQIEGSAENGRVSIDDSTERKKSALLVAAAVALYILSVVPVILADAVLGFSGDIGIVLMFIFIAAATGLLVYRGASKPRYIKADETLVEEFKEWKSRKSKKQSVRNAISSAFWTSVVAIYLVASFWFGIWSYSWLIFIIAAAINQVVKAILELKEEEI